MKKLICALLAFVLIFALAACSRTAKEELDTDGTLELPRAGVTFEIPDGMKNLKGVIQKSYGSEYEEGTGIYLSGLSYCAMSREKYDEILAKGGNLTDEELGFISTRVVDFVLVYTIDGGRTLEDVYLKLQDLSFPTDNIKSLGSVGEYSFYCVVNPFANVLNSNVTFDEGMREEYDRVVGLCDDISWIKIYEPNKPENAPAGTAVSFVTTDLDGNIISSQKIFGAHKLTMVNLWGTYCGPCINEMPDLEVLNGRLKEKDCAIIGVVIDVPSAKDKEMVKAAKDIIADTGVTYQNLIPWNGIDTELPAQFIPTTYFIDSNGTIVGEATVGANGAAEYEKLLDAALASLGE